MIKKCIIILFAVCGILGVLVCLRAYINKEARDSEPMRDTVRAVYVDTVRIVQPVARDSVVVRYVSGAAGCEMLQSALLAITISLISGMFIDIVRDTWVTGSHTGEKDLAADICGAVSAVGAMCCAGILF